ncbi:hypothetical protein CARUB_v10021679mg [Capsella rubella]|uniref:Knottin scorpion toxin-like domain-containing protein n=1 Tax=Capsella rubella TaxID=81985 RepID=R0GCB7_9BRAS|nr:hypothetical protein CARUB_v10021679mg [Capsella rubella]
MSKATIIAIFMAILVIGLVTKETQGQELCHEYYSLSSFPCIEHDCLGQCAWKHPHGKGTCMPSSRQCLCTFRCNV